MNIWEGKYKVDTYILKISFVVEMAVILYIFCTSMQKKDIFGLRQY